MVPRVRLDGHIEQQRGNRRSVAFSARGKRYGYRFQFSPVRPVLGRDLAHWVKRPLDVAAMREGAAHLIGEHDFASFATNPGYVRKRGTVRHIEHLHIVRRAHAVLLVIQGNGFLYNMVRTIAGTLRDVGLGKHSPLHVKGVLEARDCRAAGMTCEAAGLFLMRVLYPRDALVAPLPDVR